MSNGTTAFPGAIDNNTVRNSTHEITSTDHNDHSVQIEAIETALGVALRKIYPVGSIYTNAAVSTNPATLLGFGTWTAFGTGRVLVGVDTGQTEFDVLGETGGEKTHTLTTAELASHTHTQNAHTHTQNAHTHTVTDPGHVHYLDNVETLSNTNITGTGLNILNNSSGHDTENITMSATTGVTNQNTTATNQNATATNQNAGSGTAHNNLQPYITVYMWQRTV